MDTIQREGRAFDIQKIKMLLNLEEMDIDQIQYDDYNNLVIFYGHSENFVLTPVGCEIPVSYVK